MMAFFSSQSSRFPIRRLLQFQFLSFTPRPCSFSHSHFPHVHQASSLRYLQQPESVPRAFFSSRSSDFSKGPSIIDYSSILPEEKFHKLADHTLQDLQERLEEYGDEIQIDGFDIDYGNQVLTLKLGNLGTYVINKQAPNRQIWLSSPVSGPSRFDWDNVTKAWVYRRTKDNLLQLLQTELGKLCGKSIKLS